ncbi:methyltransferase domain-containing protein [Leucogyrophana mollusca]|uniref:Methyltransferase domain-containing protein n=1 Tax=Leucogyrophana mollusca TaxID=85980 RepID=A0ACB8BP11_9AGAM|nr:methyltransferase domain-containing protein [Leucogyrophana mollusca]
MASSSDVPEPDLKDGIEYWSTQPASLDGVLGGFGSGSLPRVDALGSRQFLMNLLPELSTVPSTLRPLQTHKSMRTRALDVGAGIGRVTADVLLPLVSDVVLLEPVERFINEALARGNASVGLTASHDESGYKNGWPGIADRSKSVSFYQAPLQDFDPSRPHESTRLLGRVGFSPLEDDAESRFDVIWCQWCLGHLSDVDLVDFLKRSQSALRGPRSLIVVKENLCSEHDEGPRTVFDEQDSSLTRSDGAYKNIFAEAGLSLVREQVQHGLPAGLYPVKMYALRRLK